MSRRRILRGSTFRRKKGLLGLSAEQHALLMRVERELKLGHDVSGEDVEALRALGDSVRILGADPMPSRLQARLAAVEAQIGLRARDEPASSFLGLYDRVATRVMEESATTNDAAGEAVRWRRAALSNSFLDAPRALVWWRIAACSAMAVLAVGAWQWHASASRTGSSAGSGSREHASGARGVAPNDVRHDLLSLHRYEATPELESPRSGRPSIARPVGLNRHPRFQRCAQ